MIIIKSNQKVIPSSSFPYYRVNLHKVSLSVSKKKLQHAKDAIAAQSEKSLVLGRVGCHSASQVKFYSRKLKKYTKATWIRVDVRINDRLASVTCSTLGLCEVA